jgi:Leucine-rich repeat (LRR) protein
LPEKLPDSLRQLYCYNNQLTTLPDNLPNSLQYIDVRDNPLETNYPKIFTFQINQTAKIIAYVRECNALRRARERLAIINAGNVFLERYMQRMMHPSRLATLIDNPEMDVDEYMEAYVAAL